MLKQGKSQTNQDDFTTQCLPKIFQGWGGLVLCSLSWHLQGLRVSVLRTHPHPEAQLWGISDVITSLKDFLTQLTKAIVQSLSHVSETPWTVAHQAPLSMGFPRKEYWSKLPFPFQGIFPTQGLNPCLLHQDSSPLSHQGSPMKMLKVV